MVSALQKHRIVIRRPPRLPVAVLVAVRAAVLVAVRAAALAAARAEARAEALAEARAEAPEEAREEALAETVMTTRKAKAAAYPVGLLARSMKRAHRMVKMPTATSRARWAS